MNFFKLEVNEEVVKNYLDRMVEKVNRITDGLQ